MTVRVQVLTLRLLLPLLLIFIHFPLCSSWCHYGRLTHTNDVYEASYSPDSSKVVVASKDNNHYIYNPVSFQVEYPYVGSTKSLSAKFSRDGLYIAIGLQNNSIVILSNSYAFVAAVPSAIGAIEELHFNKDSTLMLACGSVGSRGYEIFDVATWTVVYSDYTYGNTAMCCRFADNGNYAVGSQDGFVRYYSSAHSLIWSNQRNTNSPIEALDFSPNSSYLLVSWSGAGKKVGIFAVGSNSSELNLTIGSSTSNFGVDWS